MPSQSSEICYLLAFPDRVVIPQGPPEKIRGLKDAPYFQPVDISVQTLEQTRVEAGGLPVSVVRQRFDDRIQIVECRFALADVLSLAVIQQRESVEKALKERFVPADHRQSGMFEEYVILLLKKAAPTPDMFVDRHAVALARFIRSQRETFDQPEIAEILSSRLRYSKYDLTLVDWQAALIVAPQGDFQSDIELLKVGNYQLLRYRMLDAQVESNLQLIGDKFHSNPARPLRIGPTRNQIRSIVQHRLELMLDFEHTDQNLLLIGDWYTSQLYHAISEEFYLNEWKKSVKTKLDNLQEIIGTIQENFTLSWQSLLETIQITGWLILLIGYFILFFIESGGLRIR